MTYLVLARKYRPQTFQEVVQQDHITQTLTNAITAERIAHAILFCGPRGTGKTTVARILAKAMNCEQGPTPTPCNQCRSCQAITAGNAVDVYEIDGASNNNVDQVRDLRENAKYMPAHSPHKIYIIDEVHMLSNAAFNALLKTLEEPPAHVLFIFATTEPHKIPVTILSRCQRHDFRRIDLPSIVDHLVSISEKEQREIDSESLTLIAREAGGSMRDALSLMDQIMACTDEAITSERIVDVLGVVKRKTLYDLSQAVINGSIPDLLERIDEMYGHGHDLKKLYIEIVEHFRNLLIVKMGKKVDVLIDLPSQEIEWMRSQVKDVSVSYLNQLVDFLFKEELTVRLSPQPRLAMEMVFVKLIQITPALSIDVLIDKLDQLKKDLGSSAAQKPGGSGKRLPDETKSAVTPPDPPAEPVNSADPDTVWNRLVAAVGNKHPSLTPNLAKSRLKSLSDQTLVMEIVGNGFNEKMIKKNLQSIQKIYQDLFGTRINIVLDVIPDKTEDRQKQKRQDTRKKQKALNHPLVTDAIEVFNGKLVDVKVAQEEK